MGATHFAQKCEIAKVATVSIQRVAKDIYRAVDMSIQQIGGLDIKHTDTILIKPNIVEPASYTTRHITNPYLVEAIIKWCQERNPSKIVIGEGPNYYWRGHELEDIFTKTEYQEIAEKNNVEWILFDHHSFRTIPEFSPLIPGGLRLTEFIFKCSKLINVAVMKTHFRTTVTLAMKNLKGCVKREDKPRCHRDIFHAVAVLAKTISPALNIVDGTVPEGKNPSLIVVGKDIVAVDAVASSLMGFNPDAIETIRYGYQMGIGEMNLDKINIVGEDLRDITLNYELPLDKLKALFPSLNLVGVERACSGCLLPLLSLFFDYGEKGWNLSTPLTIAVGENLDMSQFKGREVVCVGNCIKVKVEAAHIKGCPPRKEDIERGLLKYFIRS